jgi:hypothetical protein
MLKFSKANAKIEALQNVSAIASFLHSRKVYSLDLLSGYSCPFARHCLSRAVIEPDGSRHIQDGPDTLFRCFSASQELVFPAVYNSRKHNFDLLRASSNKAELIANSMPADLGVCRIHVGGDFFNEEYMLAWADIAKQFPDRLFYAYTKSLPYWVKHKKAFSKIYNFVLTASYGGRFDNLIKEHRLRYSKVVLNEKQAGRLIIDHDDSAAADPSIRNKSFALLIHGIQPKGSEANEALKKLKREKVKHSYSRN